jgi:hypothetical protein
VYHFREKEFSSDGANEPDLRSKLREMVPEFASTADPEPLREAAEPASG